MDKRYHEDTFGWALEQAEHLRRRSTNEIYAQARLRAARETRLGLEAFPEAPAFTPEQARDPDWWPEA